MKAEIELTKEIMSAYAVPPVKFHIYINGVPIEWFIIDPRKSGSARAISWRQAVRMGSSRFPGGMHYTDVAKAAHLIKRIGLDPSPFLIEAERLGWGKVVLEKDEFDYE